MRANRLILGSPRKFQQQQHALELMAVTQRLALPGLRTNGLAVDAKGHEVGSATAAYSLQLITSRRCYRHGMSDACITSATPCPPTERMARSTSLSPNVCVVTFS